MEFATLTQQSNDIAITATDLSRSYVTYRKPVGVIPSIKGFWKRDYIEKKALTSTNLSIGRGQIIGLVGANGAGKTTLLKLLSGLVHPTTGTAKILGFEPWRRQSAFLKQISLLLGQKNQLWWDISPRDSFDLLARIYGLDLNDAKKRVDELAEIMSATHALNTQLRRLSLGERMKMELIGALLHKPKVMFLDEPTIGLDIVAQTAIREFIADYVKRERPTIILTSHYMDDISKLADRLLLMSHGRIVFDGELDEFVKRNEPKQHISFKIEKPLSEPLVLNDAIVIPAGAKIFECELKLQEVPIFLQLVLSRTLVSELQIKETDFEDVVREFLQSQPRMR
jgi:ABC-2 type transport system ATP-binding protein